jgi:chemotaxis protein histidine kinase CheA
MAAEAVRVNDIAEFAWSLEKALGAARLSGGRLEPEHLAAMQDATALLLGKIQALGDAKETRARRALEELAETLGTKGKIPAAS